jgi:hypothetical protein
MDTEETPKKPKDFCILCYICSLSTGIGSYAVDCTAVGEYQPSDHDRTVMI